VRPLHGFIDDVPTFYLSNYVAAVQVLWSPTLAQLAVSHISVTELWMMFCLNRFPVWGKRFQTGEEDTPVDWREQYLVSDYSTIPAAFSGG
jgi:hypothetical protein